MAASDHKRCPSCGITKRVADFYRGRRNTDGLQSACRTCQIARNQKSRLKHAEHNRERMRLYLERHAEEERARKAKWRRDNRAKTCAHRAVYRAVRSGRLERPAKCDRCGTDAFRIAAHHEDYAAPLDVTWLCSPCHGQAHREMTMQEKVA